MQIATAHASKASRIAAVFAAVVLGSGCVQSVNQVDGSGLVSSAGHAITLDPATSYTEAGTVSLALDRIDQHSLPLDRTYRHYGTGYAVTVYVFDGGVMATHPELAGRVRHGFDAFPSDGRPCNAHGTAVAGAVAGTTLGVAPQAEIVDVKMVECTRMRGTIDAIVQGTRWVLDDHARHPGQRAVANWSFVADTSASVPALDTAVAQLRAAGIPVVVSAGNLDLDACHISPSNAPGAIVVGASQIRRLAESAPVDARSPHTAFGSCIDVFAPGDSVMLPSMDANGAATTQLWTGTSMSAGYVSGAVALYLEAHPDATPADVSASLKSSSSLSAVDPRSPNAGLLYVGTAATTQMVASRR